MMTAGSRLRLTLSDKLFIAWVRHFQRGDRRGRKAEKATLWRIRICYWWRHGRLPDLREPSRFTELIQMMKIDNRDPMLPLLQDKLRVKGYLAPRIGEAMIIPTVWHGTELPDLPPVDGPFILKARHGCNQNLVFHDRPTAREWAAAKRITGRWMRSCYGQWTDEWLYSQIPPGLLIEPLIGPQRALPIDYKFYQFGGDVAFVQVHLDRAAKHRWYLLDLEWRPLSNVPVEERARIDAVRPQSLSAMIAAVARIGRDLDCARVDLYEIEGHPNCGEITFYPGSGYDRFDPVELDALLGAHWLRALAGDQARVDAA